MKISTILLSAAFMGIVCHLGTFAGRPAHTRAHWNQFQSGIDYNKARSSRHDDRQGDSALLKQLKSRSEEINRQVRDVCTALKKIGESARYLEQRLTEPRTRTDRIRRNASRFDDSLDHSGREMIQKELAALEEERVLFDSLLERLKCEQATLKVQIDLYGLSARRIMERTFPDDTEPGPLDRLSRENRSPSRVVIKR